MDYILLQQYKMKRRCTGIRGLLSKPVKANIQQTEQSYHNLIITQVAIKVKLRIMDVSLGNGKRMDDFVMRRQRWRRVIITLRGWWVTINTIIRIIFPLFSLIKLTKITSSFSPPLHPHYHHLKLP